MTRFVYTIIFFVVFSGFGIWYIVTKTVPVEIFIVLISFLFFICFGLIVSICLYFYNLKKNKIVFPYEYKQIYRKGVFNSALVSLLATLLLSFQLFQVLDLITLLLLIVFFIFIAILKSGKIK